MHAWGVRYRMLYFSSPVCGHISFAAATAATAVWDADYCIVSHQPLSYMEARRCSLGTPEARGQCGHAGLPNPPQKSQDNPKKNMCLQRTRVLLLKPTTAKLGLTAVFSPLETGKFRADFGALFLPAGPGPRSLGSGRSKRRTYGNFRLFWGDQLKFSTFPSSRAV